MNALLNSLFAGLWAVTPWATALAAALLLLRRLARRLPARAWRVVWLVVALRLALPADLSLPGAPLQMPAPAAVSAIYEQSEAARPAAEADEGAARGQAAARADREGIGAPALRALGQALPGLWAAGALAFLAWNGAAYGVFCARLRRSRRPVTDAALLAAARRAFGRDVPVYECGEAAGPMLAGLVRPALYLPGDLPAADRPYVLAHEARHLQAWDVPYQFLLLGMQTVQWFNPAAHLLARRARADLELACDEAVLAGRDEAYRRAYGGAVLDSLRARRRACLLGTGFAGGKKTLKERILQIMNTDLVARNRPLWVVALLVVAALSALVAGAVKGGDGPQAADVLREPVTVYGSDSAASLPAPAAGGAQEGASGEQAPAPAQDGDGEEEQALLEAYLQEVYEAHRKAAEAMADQAEEVEAQAQLDRAQAAAQGAEEALAEGLLEQAEEELRKAQEAMAQWQSWHNGAQEPAQTP